jgi:hypothetical protein
MNRPQTPDQLNAVNAYDFMLRKVRLKYRNRPMIMLLIPERWNQQRPIHEIKIDVRRG